MSGKAVLSRCSFHDSSYSVQSAHDPANELCFVQWNEDADAHFLEVNAIDKKLDCD